jgi:sec-independent protein translocase protein TatB
MFDLSWGEVMVIGAVALIVIGPKDLPKALRTVGNVTGKVRRMAAEFQSQFNDAMREAELDEIRKQVEGVNQSVMSLNDTSFNPIQTVRDELKGAIEGPVPPSGSTEPGPNPLIPPDEPAALPPVPEPAAAIAAAGLPAAPAPAGEPEHAAPGADRAGEGRA